MNKEAVKKLILSFLTASLFFACQKIVDSTAEYTCETDNFDVGHKPFAALDSLYCVFVNIETDKLKPVCKLTLGNVQFTAEYGNIFAA